MKFNSLQEDVIEIRKTHYALGSVDEYGRKKILPLDRNPKNPKDQKILEAIELAFNESPEVNPTQIEIFVHSGHVTLTGAVTTLSQKFECEDIVHNISGVHSVINDIEVVNTNRRNNPARDEFGYH